MEPGTHQPPGAAADPTGPEVPWPPTRTSPCEWFGLGGLAIVLAYALTVSWLKWADPLVDFGRELYLPWRLSNGAVLYRDADDFYGPLSQYLNAGLFHAFGPGLSVLVGANLAVFLLIAALLYHTVRRAWGPAAALASTAVFIAVFGFAQPVLASNFNFATPYAHEATHGFCACLLLLAVLSLWVREPTAIRSAAAGFLLGVAAVLKPEILLSAAVVTCAAAALRLFRREPIGAPAILIWGGAAALPTLGFALYFSRFFPWADSLALACRAWLNAVGSTKYVGDPVQIKALGFDEPWAHLGQLGLSTAAAVAVVAAIAGAAVTGNRLRRPGAWVLLWAGVLGATGWLAWSVIHWFEIGRCFLGLLLIYVAFKLRQLLRGGHSPSQDLRLLGALLAASLMARMLLNGRIYQFGFYQAALAAVVISAVLVGELPSWLRVGRPARLLAATAALLLVAIGAVRLEWRSTVAYRNKTVEIGTGRDRFYAFSAKIWPTGELVQDVLEALGHVPPGASLLVLPEGEMVNYLARMPSPVAPFFFFSAATEGGGEAAIVRQLTAHPPAYVVVISRNLQEYGLHYYGETYGQGRAIIEWVEAHYQVLGTFGGNPIDPDQQGAVILGWGG